METLRKKPSGKRSPKTVLRMAVVGDIEKNKIPNRTYIIVEELLNGPEK